MTDSDRYLISTWDTTITGEAWHTAANWVLAMDGFLANIRTKEKKKEFLNELYQPYLDYLLKIWWDGPKHLDTPRFTFYVNKEHGFPPTGVKSYRLWKGKYTELDQMKADHLFRVNAFDWINRHLVELESTNDEENDDSKTKDGNPWSANNSQTVLILYFGLLALDIDIDKFSNDAGFARLLHMVAGKEYTNLDNSDFYDKIKLVPIVNENPRTLLRNLETVRNQFDKIKFKEALPAIEKEILRTQDEIATSKIKPKQAK